MSWGELVGRALRLAVLSLGLAVLLVVVAQLIVAGCAPR